ncbi:MAG: Rne/Rng family ribonuclease [Candidatus Omnitrophica bacterium]|nr:Rne/Rng family ribonuclease [Candidatus Omnitrophota bacterium]MDD5352729.1 Rne/Rng family ribonuclease [Candidatus Omnitrophota bacterium]MDD5550328.1 Rne/Rng family ribonuclease [Candidatus Omnitrophota bacterium]
MSREILINVEEKEKRIAIVENNKLADFFIEHPEDRTIVGNIYKGRIQDVVPSVGAAFVDIGQEKNGFLYLNDVTDFRFDENELEEFSSENQKKNSQMLELKKDQEVLVQVTKEPFSGKGARLTTHVSLPGRYLVLMPFDRHFGISRKIEEPEERKRIREILRSFNLGQDYGIIVRTAAWGKDRKSLTRDLHFLLNLWDRIKKVSVKYKSPYLLYEDYDLVLRTVRDYFTEDIDRLIVDSKIEYKRIYKFVSAFLRQLVRKIVFHRDPASLFDKHGVEKEVENIYRNKIYLRCGGHIVIEQTEGLIVVDVNSGSFSQKKSKQEDAAFKVNSESAEEVARQLRLRDLSGIIVIDFIDMQQEGHRRELLKILKMALTQDKAKTDVVGISRLGLVEMTRERVHRSIESISYKDCPYCRGKGKVKSEVAMAGYVFRHLRNNLNNFKARKVDVTLHPNVANKIMVDNRNSIRDLERKFRKRINIVAQPGLHIEDIRIS